MITDERFDELVKRAGTLTSDVIQNLPESDWVPVFREILDDLMINERGADYVASYFNNKTAAGAQEAQKE